MHSYDFFPSNYLARIYIYIYIYVWNHCEYSDHAIQAIILSHLWLKWTNMQIRFFFPRYIVLFVILCDGCFFTAEKKGINNKLFQILGGVYTSLQNRRFTSQARRTRHFARSVRRGEEKNKAAVTSPLFWLFRPPTPTSIDWRRWCQKDQSKHDTLLENSPVSSSLWPLN